MPNCLSAVGRPAADNNIDNIVTQPYANLAIKISSLLIGLNGYVSSTDSLDSANVKPVLS